MKGDVLDDVLRLLTHVTGPALLKIAFDASRLLEMRTSVRANAETTLDDGKKDLRKRTMASLYSFPLPACLPDRRESM